ncbi:aspartyl/asparaginyl beta-hydroxylase domain-containing protein [Paraburkholderia youngii]|uniref:aspartyl/asparaginyl beta-hydroxylase domain-containing protein n=1 Tax=Paraburkholderia youngii TaxID=2782701 RepID=UPI003D242370
MKNFLKIGSGLDTVPLLLAIQRRPEIWSESAFMRKQAIGPEGDTQSVLLRRLDAERILAGVDVLHENHDQPVYQLLPEARGIVMGLMARVGGERLGQVMLNKIRPGGRISPHVDAPALATYYDRFHVVLQSAPGVTFRTGDEQVYMAPGETWWFQNAVEHEVTNNSSDDRIHLIVDIRTSKP